jgi:hypothetical protein
LTRTVTAGKEVVSKRLNTVHESSAIQQVPVMPQELTIEDMVKQITVGQGKKTKSSTQISLLQLLSQAIHAGDVELYEKAFAVNDKKIIHATVKKLSPTQVLPLIDQLVTRLQRRPNRGLEMVEWIRACIVNHSSYLISVFCDNIDSRDIV